MDKTDSGQRLKNFFEQTYGQKIPDTEVAEYKDRLVKFFELLIGIDQRNKRLKKN